MMMIVKKVSAQVSLFIFGRTLKHDFKAQDLKYVLADNNNINTSLAAPGALAHRLVFIAIMSCHIPLS